MANGNKEDKNRLNQKIFLLNSVISDKTISDNGILVYCYLKAIQRADMNYYPISVEIMDYYFRHTFDMDVRDKRKYVEGLQDLEDHGLIKKINEKKYDFEYDLQPIYFDPSKTNNENKRYFTVVFSNEICSIMQISSSEFTGSKAKLLRYFVNVVSTFLKGDSWMFEMDDGTLRDGIVGTSSIDILSNISNVNKDTVIAYNDILMKEKLLYIYKAGTLKIVDKQISGITNTYGRYEHKKYVIGEGEDHKVKYEYNQTVDSLKHKTKKTAERKALGAKYFYLLSGQKEYDEQTIIDIYRYAVEYNKIHEGDCFYEDKLKDLDFFEQYPFITENCLQEETIGEEN